MDAVGNTRVSARKFKGQHPTKVATAEREAREAAAAREAVAQRAQRKQEQQEQQEQLFNNQQLLHQQLYQQHLKQYVKGASKPQHGAKQSARTLKSRARSRAPRSASPLAILDPGHKIARGRGRKKQLDMMTEEQKRAEKQMRMEKMRLAARECRARKKMSIIGLEQKLEQYVVLDKKNRDLIGLLQSEVSQLKVKLQQAEERAEAGAGYGISNKSIKPDFNMRIDTSMGGTVRHMLAAAQLQEEQQQQQHYVPVYESSAHTVPEQGSNVVPYEQDATIDYAFSFDQEQNVCLG